MPKQLNVNLAFTADTGQAKRELQTLLKELEKLNINSLGDNSLGTYTKELQHARDAAIDLRNKLAEATDVNTGKLDLSKFSQSMKASGMDLKKYQEQLANLGPSGDRAFASLANSILKAELPLKRTSGLLEQFKTTLANTARWQISSSILHGFQGALQTAWYYAQDLNKSLNNIQIVTQNSNEQMAQFAINANKAAHELSATTTAYTDAALIYYQQGLNDQQVKARTDVTVKLANVTGTSAQAVSEQMTAIWNNFDDGSKSMEHYADVLTALGASTASSSAEIAGGMQQFAASAQTVGLSYEYAASALATVVAATRQSENVVGNAFKTLFSRLEGLNLGETLDDGTTLNKYSAALEKVGISIKDQNGQLRAMDDILNDLGAKWGTLAKDQQMALAQTVGGVRQYTQLIALMDNWGEFQKNLQTANTSDGSLQKQADIYADSWQAAQKRVQASLEQIYHDLINDKAFIKFLDFIDNVIQGIDKIIKGIGGLGGVLSGLSTLVLNIFGKELTQGLNNLTYNLNLAKAQAEAIEQKREAAQAMKTFGASNADELVGGITSEVYQQRGQLQEVYLQNYERLTSEQQKQVQLALDLNTAQGDYLIGLAEEVSKQEEEVRIMERKARVALKGTSGLTPGDISQFETDNKIIGGARLELENLQKAFENGTLSEAEFKAGLKNIKDALLDLYDASDDNIDLIHSDAFKSSVNATIESLDELDSKLNNTEEKIKLGSSKFGELQQSAQNTVETMKDLSSTAVDGEYFANQSEGIRTSNEALMNLGNSAQVSGERLATLKNVEDGVRESSNKLGTSINNLQKPLMTTNELIVKSAQGVSGLVFALKSISGIIDTINDKDMSFGEKAIAVLGSAVLLIPQLINSYNILNSVYTQITGKIVAKTVATTAETVAEGVNTGAVNTNTGAVLANNAAWYANPIVWIIGILVAVTMAISKMTAEQEKNTQALKDNAAKAEEAKNKHADLVKTQQEATKQLSDLEQGWKKTGEASAEFTSYLDELINVYNIQDGKLLLLQGKYDVLINKIKTAHEEELKRARDTAQDATKADTALLNDVFQNNDKLKWSSDVSLGQNQSQINLVTETAQKYGLEDVFNLQKNIIGNTSFSIGTMSVEQLPQVLEALTELEQKGIAISDNVLLGLQEVLNSEEYKKVQADLQDEKIIDLQIRLNNTSISSMAEMSALMTSLQGEGYQYSDAIAQASMYLGELASDYDLVRTAAFQANVPIEEMAKAYDSLPDEKKKFFGQIDFSKVDSINNLEQAIDDLQNNASTRSVTIKLDAAQDDVNSFNEKGTILEKQQWAKNTTSIDWGETEQEQLSKQMEFLSMTVEEQNAFLAQHLVNTKEIAVQTLNEMLASGVDAFDEYANLTEEELSQVEQSLRRKQAGLGQTLLDAERLGLSEDEVARIETQLQVVEQELNNFYNSATNAANQYNEASIKSSQMQLELADSYASMGEVEQAIAKGVLTDVNAINYAYDKFRGALDEDIELEAFKDMSKYLKENAKDVTGLSKQLTVNKKAAEAVAKAILRYDSAIQKVTDHYDEWVDALESGNEYEQAEALKEIRNNFNDILDMPFDTLSDKFVNSRENLDLMKEAAEGNEEAYNDLLAAANQDILTTVGLDDVDFQTKYADIKGKVDAGLQDIQAGAYIDDSQAIQAMNELINSADMTAQQATDLLASMGVDAEVEQVDVPANSEYAGADASITYDYAESPDLLVGGTTTTRIPVPNITYTATPEVVPGEMTATALRVKSARKASGGGIKQNLAPSGGGGSKGGGGGGGSKPKHQNVKHVDHQKTANTKNPEQSGERYHVINNQIEDLAKQYDRLSEAEERAFGKSKLALMDAQTAKLKEQYAAQRQLRKEAEAYLKTDMENLVNGKQDTDGDGKLDTLGSKAYLGKEVQFDKNGTILNYEDLVDSADARYNKFINSYNNFINAYNGAIDAQNAAIDEYNSLSAEDQEAKKEEWQAKQEQWEAEKEGWEQQKEVWDQRQEEEQTYYDNFMGLIDQYEDTQDKVQEELNKEIEAYHAILDKMLEKTEYTVQLKIDIADDAIKIIEFLEKTVYNSEWAAADKIKLAGDKFEETTKKIDADKTGLVEMFSNHAVIDQDLDGNDVTPGRNAFVDSLVTSTNKDVQAAAQALQDIYGKLEEEGLSEETIAGLTKQAKEQGEVLGQAIVDGLSEGDQDLANTLGGMTNEFTDKEVQDWRQTVSRILDNTASLWQQREDIFAAMDEYIDAANQKLDDTVEHMEHLADVAGKYRDIIDIAGHNKGGFDTATIKAMTATQQALKEDALKASKARNDLAKANLEKAKQELETLKASGKASQRDIDLWEQEITKLQKDADAAESKMLDDLVNVLQGAKEQFRETIQLMAEDASKAMGGLAGSLEGVSTQMAQYEKTHSTFVPEYERVYQLNKLNAAAIKAIDETNNIKAKQELLKYQQKINEAQESGREMSEWELQNLEKELALRQATLALEEATNVKSQVRMSRDNEGNYSYIYTADEGAVDKAQSDYRDKLYEMQKSNAEYINQLQTDIVSLKQEYLNAIQEAADLYGEGSDEYYQALNRINEWYGKAVQDKYDQLGLVMQANQDLQVFDAEFHARMTGDKMVSDQGYVTQFDQTVLSQITGYKTVEEDAAGWAAALNDFNVGVGETTSALQNAVEQYNSAANQAMIDAGNYVPEGQSAWEAFGNYLLGSDGNPGALPNLQSESEKLSADVIQLAQDYDTAINGPGGIMDTVEQWEEDYSPRIDDMTEKNKNLATQIGLVIEGLAGIKAESPVDVKITYDDPGWTPPNPDPVHVEIIYDDPGWAAPSATVEADTSGSGGDDSDSPGGQPTPPTKVGGLFAVDDGNPNTHLLRQKWSNGTVTDERRESHYFEGPPNSATGVCVCGRSGPRSGFASGGYTGDWGSSEGKLAILHEKELVLNKDDTSKMLSAVNLVRQISQTIDLNAASASTAFSAMLAGQVNMGAQQLEQEVHITAEFPNATDRNEIMSAFENVVNLASQYANRKGPDVHHSQMVKF